MSSRTSSTDKVPPGVWQRFLQALVEGRVPEPQRPWYARRVETYLGSGPARPVERHVPRNIEAHLAALGQSGRLTDWQFVQAVHALQVFFNQAVGAPWAARFDWGHWKDSAQRIAPEHPDAGA